jgi:hypothetical protein
MVTENCEGEIILCDELSYVWVNMVWIQNIYIDDDDDDEEEEVNVVNFAVSK